MQTVWAQEQWHFHCTLLEDRISALICRCNVGLDFVTIFMLVGSRMLERERDSNPVLSLLTETGKNNWIDHWASFGKKLFILCECFFLRIYHTPVNKISCNIYRKFVVNISEKIHLKYDKKTAKIKSKISDICIGQNQF